MEASTSSKASEENVAKSESESDSASVGDKSVSAASARAGGAVPKFADPVSIINDYEMNERFQCAEMPQLVLSEDPGSSVVKDKELQRLELRSLPAAVPSDTTKASAQFTCITARYISLIPR